jgi:hypothetical protein
MYFVVETSKKTTLAVLALVLEMKVEQLTSLIQYAGGK